MSEEKYQLKIIVIGQPSVGKTCLVQRISRDTFTNDYKITLGTDFAISQQTVNYKGHNIKLSYQLWDIAGQEYTSRLVPFQYRNSMACLLICDLSSQTIINDIELWYKQIKSKVFVKNTTTQLPIILVCNKSDLQASQTRWEDLSFQDSLKQFQFDDIVKCSALSRENIEILINKLNQRILITLEQNNMFTTTIAPGPSHVIVPEESPQQHADKSGGSCC